MLKFSTYKAFYKSLLSNSLLWHRANQRFITHATATVRRIRYSHRDSHFLKPFITHTYERVYDSYARNVSWGTRDSRIDVNESATRLQHC